MTPPRQLSPTAAAVIAALLVAGGVLGGLAVARVGAARPAATPALAPTTAPAPATATATPSTESDPVVFLQPLVAACAVGDALVAVSDGGAIARFDGQRWSLIDTALRSLSAVACAGDAVVAVGAGGRVVYVDDRLRTVRVDTTSAVDLLGVSALPAEALAVGRGGTVLRYANGVWALHAAGLEEDLYGVAAFAATSAWVVGAAGAAYRLEERGWRPVATGVGVTLRALAARDVSSAVAVGDGGTVLALRGRWTALPTGTDATLRAVALVGAGAWAVGDRGTIVRVADLARGDAERGELGTACTLRAVVARADDVWIVGSEGARSAVWRMRGDRIVARWGDC